MMLGRLTIGSRPKWTTPRELGIPFPEIKKIFYNGCGYENSKEETHFVRILRFGVTGIGAHTHQCPNEDLYKVVCFSNEEEMLNYDGSPSDCMWHEYGHILWEYPKEISNWTCLGPDSYHKFDIPSGIDIDYDPHGEGWKQIMRDLGKPHLTSLWTQPSIKSAQAAARIVGNYDRV